MVMVVQIGEYPKRHQIVHFKSVGFMVCEINLCKQEIACLNLILCQNSLLWGAVPPLPPQAGLLGPVPSLMLIIFSGPGPLSN